MIKQYYAWMRSYLTKPYLGPTIPDQVAGRATFLSKHLTSLTTFELLVLFSGIALLLYH